MALITAATATPHKAIQQLIKGERHLFSSSDDTAVMKQVLATHSPDGREVEVRPLLRVVEDVLQRATPTVVVVPQQAQLEILEDKVHQVEVVGMLEALAYTIHKISCEITCKCSGGSDAHATTLALFHTLANYSWDSKVVLALAAFAVSYGEFWLTAQLHTVNPLAKSVALLKHLPDILEHMDVLKPRFDAINNLIKAMMDVTKCIIEFKELPADYLLSDSPDIAKAQAHIPTAVYWTIRSIVACASQIIGLIGLGHEYITSTTEAWELSSLAHKVNSIYGHLIKQLENCRRHIEEKQQLELYQVLTRLFETVHIDNMKILRALISSKDEQPLYDGTTKRRASIDVLRRKIVMLYVSDLDISHEELSILTQIYNATRDGKYDRDYEIVWLPIMDRHAPWNSAKDEIYNRLASIMPWHSVNHPSMVDPAVVRYVRSVWRFDKKPLLVVLDPQGKVVSTNAIHMICIWGTLAFPFTSSREEALWKEETWRLEFLADEIDPNILTLAREGRYVCLYGGEDLDWIRRFTSLLRRAAQDLKLPLEMVYVGKSTPKERIKKVTAVIAAEKLSSYFHDPTMVWFFWARLESMLHSKMQYGKLSGTDQGEDDQILHEVMTLLSYDGSGQSWAVITRGLAIDEIVREEGQKLVGCLGDFEKWRPNAEVIGFLPALEEALQPYQTHEHCTRLILPGDASRIKEQVVCAECKLPMEKFVLYRCCKD